MLESFPHVQVCSKGLPGNCPTLVNAAWMVSRNTAFKNPSFGMNVKRT